MFNMLYNVTNRDVIRRGVDIIFKYNYVAMASNFTATCREQSLVGTYHTTIIIASEYDTCVLLVGRRQWRRRVLSDVTHSGD